MNLEKMVEAYSLKKLHIVFMTASVLFALVFLLSPMLALAVFFSLLFICFIYIMPEVGYYICLIFVPTTSFLVGYMNTLVLSGTTINVMNAEKSIVFAHIPVLATFLVVLVKGMSLKAYPSTLRVVISENPYILPLFFLSWGIVTLFWSLNVSYGIVLAINLLMGIIFMVIMHRFITDKEGLIKTIKFLVFISFFMGIANFLSKYFSGSYNKEIFHNTYVSAVLYQVVEEKRAGGFASTNLASATIVFFIFMVTAVYPYIRSRFVLVFLFFWWLFLLLDIIIMSSKVGMVSFIAGMFFLSIVNPNLRKKAIIWCTATVVILVTVFMLNVTILSDKRMASKGSGNLLVGSFTSRIKDWEKGFEVLKSTWIGAGLGGTSSIIKPSPEEHSTYFSILFDTGIIGFIIFTGFILQVGLRLAIDIRKNRDDSLPWLLHCISAAFLSLLIQGLMNNFQYTYYFWLVMGLAFSVTRILKQQVNILSQGSND